jgi:hypothetical protein
MPIPPFVRIVLAYFAPIKMKVRGEKDFKGFQADQAWERAISSRIRRQFAAGYREVVFLEIPMAG